MFSESPKEPALIISSFRKSINGEKPVLKAAFLNGDIFVGDNQLVALTKIKTKNELIGEVIGLLMSPIQRVIGALQNRPETPAVTEAKAQVAETKAAVAEAKAAPETKPEPATPAKAEDTHQKQKHQRQKLKLLTQKQKRSLRRLNQLQQILQKLAAKAEVTEPKAATTEVHRQAKREIT